MTVLVVFVVVIVMVINNNNNITNNKCRHLLLWKVYAKYNDKNLFLNVAIHSLIYIRKHITETK
jgi:hypothetical protein